MWSIKTDSTYIFDIYIAGDINDIKRSCNQFCLSGFCLSVFPCSYCYKFGREEGAKITLINYPRFPLSKYQLQNKAKEVALYLAEDLGQGSFSIVGPDSTEYFTRKQ